MYYLELLAHYGVWIGLIIASIALVFMAIGCFCDGVTRSIPVEAFVGLGLIVVVPFIWKKIPIPEHPDVAIQREMKKQREIRLQENKRLEAKKKEEEQIKSEILEIAKVQIPELYKAVIETKQMTVKINENKTKLTDVLIKIKRKPEEDEDIKNYNHLLEILKTNSKEYDKQLEDAYLQYQKFLISSDPEYKKIIEKLNEDARQSLEESVKKFKEMRNELSEERTKENLDK